jgi:hypothetical protein
VVAVAGVILPLQITDSAGGSRQPQSASDQAAALPSLAAMQHVWDLRLRRDLSPSDATLAAEPIPAAASLPANFPVALLGTVGNSLAMLQDSSGQVELRAVGETVAGVEILEVKPYRVQVRYNGKVQTLEKPSEPQGGM